MEDYHELALRVRAASRQIFEPDSPDPRWKEAEALEWAAQQLLRDLRDFKVNFRRNHTAPVTYWDLISDAERKDLESRPAGGPECMSCGQPFKTDADFWKHYITKDLETPRSTGKCWKRAAPEYAGRRPEWPQACIEMHCRGVGREHDYGSETCDWEIANGIIGPKGSF